METPHIRYAIDMCIKSGRVYKERWKTILCMFRYSQISGAKAHYDAILLQYLSQGGSQQFAEEYIDIMSLSESAVKKESRAELERVSNIVSGKTVKITPMGK